MEEITEAAAIAAEKTIISHTETLLNIIKSFFTWQNLFKIIGAVIIILILWIIYRLLLRGIRKFPEEKTNKHRQMILLKGVKYCFYFIITVYVLELFGIKLSALWGAAGIAGVAIGFAAQTSVSNIISGIFVLTEHTLKVGDTIIVDNITGVVDSVSLLSVRVQTFDNQMVRIPNSTIINSSLTNNSFNDKRRLTLNVSISYDSDMAKALEALSRAPSLCPTAIPNCGPAAWFDGFDDSGIKMVVAAWFKPADFVRTKNDLYIAVKQVFDEAGIEIPFNQLDVKIKTNE